MKKTKRRHRISMAKCRDRVKWLAGKLRREVGAKDVVADAYRNPNSPFYRHFDWNVQSAAKKHWLWQARQLLGRLKVIYHDSLGNEVKVREYVRLLVKEGPTHELRGRYVPRARALATADLTAQCEEQALQEQLTWRNRWRGLKMVETSLAHHEMFVSQLKRARSRKYKKAK